MSDPRNLPLDETEREMLGLDPEVTDT